jgi:hypothetical protein
MKVVSSHIIISFYCIRCDNVEILFSYLEVSNKSTSLSVYNTCGRKSWWLLCAEKNAAYKLGLSCLQKITAAFCMLCNGVATNITDEYVYIGESTAIKSMRRLIISVVELFEDEYLRTPNQNDTTRLLAHCGGKKFPGHARMYRLYALEVKELSYNMAQYVLRSCSSANNNIKSCCI